MRRLACVVLILAACGGKGTIGDPDGGAPGADGGSGSSCTSTGQCAVGLVCNTATGACATPSAVTCDMHADCGGQAFCNPQGVCEVSQLGSPCGGDPDCALGNTCIQGHCGCGASFVNADRVPANVLIALDRSSSMVTNNVPDTDPVKNRWTVAKEAIATMLADYQDQIRFGLKLWPGSDVGCDSGGDCSNGYVAHDPALGQATAINGTLAAADTCMYGTPITGAITSLVDYDGLEDPTRNNYLLFITDGRQNDCTGDPVAAVTTLTQQNPVVKTFVIGFSGDVDATQLTSMANAGLVPRAGSPPYYQADNETQLAAALDSIAATAISCNYALASAPPDVSELVVYFDGVRVDRDFSHATGWDYVGGQVIFYGASCDALRAGDVTDLAILYGCSNAMCRAIGVPCTTGSECCSGFCNGIPLRCGFD